MNTQTIMEYLLSKVTPIQIAEDRFSQELVLANKEGTKSSIILWRNGVIECRIEDLETSYYYLHFEYETFASFTKLIDDYLLFMKDFYNKEAAHILVCCSGGFTSSLLADGVNRIIQEMKYPMTIEFGSCFHVNFENKKYDLILLAPQIGYMKNQLKSSCLIDIIPTNIYGASNYHGLLTFILNCI